MRTVVTFGRQGADITIALDLAPMNIPGMGDTEIVAVPAALPVGTEAVGAALAAMLRANPVVQAALMTALAAPAGSSPSPLYFDVRAAAADALPWEAIFVGPPFGFCALDERWPIGRIATVRREVGVRVFTPPVRLVAVLAANGRSGLPQFESLRRAVAEHAGSAVPVVLHVITNEDAVVAAAEAAGVPVERIKGTKTAVADQIRDANPHILHVLSHGGVVGGMRSLFLATSADGGPEADEMQPGSVGLPAEMLIRALLRGEPWLVVLSACDTAESTGAGPALANEIASAGIPAVIGMRRLVDLGETNRFCRELYPRVLGLALGSLTPGKGSSLDWASTLTGPRAVLSGADPSTSDSWTDPVLYAQNQLLQIVTMVPREPTPQVIAFAERQGELDRWRAFRATFDADTPQAFVDEVQERIVALETALVPVPA